MINNNEKYIFCHKTGRPISLSNVLTPDAKNTRNLIFDNSADYESAMTGVVYRGKFKEAKRHQDIDSDSDNSEIFK